MRTKNVRYLIKSNGPQRVESTRRVTLYNDFAGCADAVLYLRINVGRNFCVPVSHGPISLARSRNCMGSTVGSCLCISFFAACTLTKKAGK